MQVTGCLHSVRSPASQGSWFAIHTRYQHEKAVAQALANKQFEVFLPLYAAVRRWKDREKQLSLPLFPCYVFIRGGLERRLDIVTTSGINGWAGIGGRPSPIPDNEIEAVRRVADWSHKVEPHPYLKCGDRVRVKSGPLAGLEGILVRKRNLFRLVLSVELLVRALAVEVEASCVERVETGRSRPSALQWSLGAVWA